MRPAENTTRETLSSLSLDSSESKEELMLLWKNYWPSKEFIPSRSKCLSNQWNRNTLWATKILTVCNPYCI